MISRNSKKNLFSIFFTLFVIGFLVLSGSVEAIIISLSADEAIYSIDDTVTFDVSIDIETNERIPIQNLTLTVRDPSNNAKKTCVFRPDGTAITGCDNMIITPTINAISYGYGYGYGYQQGYGYGTQGNTFGYGYGYGSAEGVEGELKYTVEWDLSSETVEVGTYDATLAALVKSETTEYVYLSSTLYFTIGSVEETQTLTDSTLIPTDPIIKDTIPKIENLTAGWVVNMTVYGENAPGWTAPSNTGLSFMEINVNHDTSGGSYTVYFNIPQSILTANSISAEDVRLFVLEGTTWVELPTTVMDGVSDPAQFSAVTTHFSKFVAAKKVTTPPADTTPILGGGGGGGGGGAGLIRRLIPPVPTPVPTPTPTPAEVEEEETEVEEEPITEASPEVVPVAEVTPPPVEGGLGAITGAVVGAAGGKTGVSFIMIIIIIAGMFLAAKLHGGMPWADKLSRASNFHKRAEKAHKKGRHEKSRKLYKQAQLLRGSIEK